MKKYKNLKLKSLEIDGKRLPEKYIAVFNDYIDEISDIIVKEERKNTCEEIRGHLLNLCDWKEDKLQGYWYATEKKINYVIDQVEKNEVGEINE